MDLIFWPVPNPAERLLKRLHVRLSVCTDVTARKQLTECLRNLILESLLTSVDTFQLWSNSDKTNGHFT